MNESEQMWQGVQARQVRELLLLDELLWGRAMQFYGNSAWRSTIRGYVGEAHAQEAKLAQECIGISERQEQAA